MQAFVIFPLLLASLFMSSEGVDADKMGQELQPILDSLVQKHTLKFGQSCDYSVEQEKWKHEKALIHMISTLTVEKGINEEKLVGDLIRNAKSIASIDGTFCNGYANLQCTSKGVCDCAYMDETYGFKMSFKRDGDACLIARGSICAPPEVLEQSKKTNPLLINVPDQEFRCADKSDCVVKSNGKGCTIGTMQAEFERYIKTEMTPGTDPIAFVVSKTKQGVCVCKGIPVLASMLLVFLSVIFTLVKPF